MSIITYGDIKNIYVDVLEGLDQQLLDGQFNNFWKTFPRDPVVLARGIGAAFGVEFIFRVVDFYKSIELPLNKKALFCFHENYESRIIIYVNSNKNNGESLVSPESQRFAIAKEVFISTIRRAFIDKRRDYPTTTDIYSIYSSLIDWVVERPSIYDVGGRDDSAVPSIENAAEILTVLFLTNIHELALSKIILDFHNGKSGRIIDFPFDELAKKYGIKVRYIYILVRSSFLVKFNSELLKSIQYNTSLFNKLNLGDTMVDIVTLLGVTGSIASIISLLQSNGIKITKAAVENEIAIQSKGQSDSLVNQIPEDELSQTIGILVDISFYHQTFLDRISQKCLRRFEDAKLNYSLDEHALADIFEQTRKCVCDNIELAKQTNGGEFPSEAFKILSQKYRCHRSS